jgi:hypothetical protein
MKTRRSYILPQLQFMSAAHVQPHRAPFNVPSLYLNLSRSSPMYVLAFRSVIDHTLVSRKQITETPMPMPGQNRASGPLAATLSLCV